MELFAINEWFQTINYLLQERRFQMEYFMLESKFLEISSLRMQVTSLEKKDFDLHTIFLISIKHGIKEGEKKDMISLDPILVTQIQVEP